MILCFALYGNCIVKNGGGATAQRTLRFSGKTDLGTKKPHSRVDTSKHSASPLAGFSVVFAEDHIVHVKTDDLVLHHVNIVLLSI